MTDFKTPGQLIEAELEERGWSQRTLAIVMKRSESSIAKMIQARQPVDADTALVLEDVLGIPAERLLDLQRDYELGLARLSERPDPGRADRATLYGDLPIAEMIKRGWVQAQDVRDTSKVEAALVKFFRAKSLSEIEILPHAAKKTIVSNEPTPAQLAWLYRAKAMSEEMLCPQYTKSALRAALNKLRPLMVAPEEARKVPRILAECGVRLVIVETLTSAKIDGVCFWLDANSPVIGLSLRHDRIDNFWFVLRHEIEHILQEHGRSMMYLDTELEGERAGTGAGVPDEERIANRAAADFCVPQVQLAAFIARKAPLFTARDLKGFARILGVHPGIVAGQLQHETGRYQMFRDHLAKIRPWVTSSAMVDGWGSVAPVDI